MDDLLYLHADTIWDLIDAKQEDLNEADCELMADSVYWDLDKPVNLKTETKNKLFCTRNVNLLADLITNQDKITTQDIEFLYAFIEGNFKTKTGNKRIGSEADVIELINRRNIELALKIMEQDQGLSIEQLDFLIGLLERSNSLAIKYKKINGIE